MMKAENFSSSSSLPTQNRFSWCRPMKRRPSFPQQTLDVDILVVFSKRWKASSSFKLFPFFRQRYFFNMGKERSRLCRKRSFLVGKVVLFCCLRTWQADLLRWGSHSCVWKNKKTAILVGRKHGAWKVLASEFWKKSSSFQRGFLQLPNSKYSFVISEKQKCKELPKSFQIFP